MDNDLALLHQKLDYLTEQFETQRRRQDEINELVNDAVPVVNHMIKLSIDELAEIGTDFQLEDLTFSKSGVDPPTANLRSFKKINPVLIIVANFSWFGTDVSQGANIVRNN